MYTAKERANYNSYRDNVCKQLGMTKNQFNLLRRKGEELRKLYEDYCNGDIEAQEEYEDREDRLQQDVYIYLEKQKPNIKTHRIWIYFQTDPRGAALYLDGKPIPENNYTQAYCIY